MTVEIYPSTLAPPTAATVATDLATHEADTANPHAVTAAQAGAVALATYDAHTILAATSDNTPAAVTIAEQRIVGRKTGGNITALTGAEVGAMIALGDLSDVGTATPTNGHILQGNGTSWGNAALAASLPEPGGTPTAGYVPVATGTGQASTWTAPTTGDADAIHDNVAGEIAAIAQKTAPAAGDHLIIEDSADSDAKKRLLVGDIPRDVLLVYDGTADGAAISQHTTATADRTTATRAWNFVLDGATYDSIYGSGGWKVVALVRGKTQNALDNFKLSLYDIDGAAVIGTDGGVVVGTAYDDMTFEWSTGLPSAKITANVAYYNDPGSTGHLSYIQSIQVYVRAA